jgi:Mu transposase, C-terminal domain
LRAWLVEIADVRIHGTTHQRPLDRFAAEARALIDIVGHPSFVQAMVRDRVVAEDWLVSIDSNRYSGPCRLIGKTVQVVRHGAHWQIFHQGQLVAEHAIIAGRYQLSVLPEHGPGALARNAMTRFASAVALPRRPHDPEVEVRDLAEYDACVEVAA